MMRRKCPYMKTCHCQRTLQSILFYSPFHHLVLLIVMFVGSGCYPTIHSNQNYQSPPVLQSMLAGQIVQSYHLATVVDASLLQLMDDLISNHSEQMQPPDMLNSQAFAIPLGKWYVRYKIMMTGKAEPQIATEY